MNLEKDTESNRLIAFGCSNTYGQGLADCYVPPTKDTPHGQAGPIPSKFVWPEIVANGLGRTCVNMAWPGASNKLICNRIEEFSFHPSDLVIIMWSYQDRYTLFKEKVVGAAPFEHNIAPGKQDEVSKAFYTHLHTERGTIIENRVNINYANFILRELNLPVFNLFADKKEYPLLKVEFANTIIPIWFGENYLRTFPGSLDSSTYPKGKGHVGEEGQKAFGEDIFRYITQPRF